MVFPSGGHQGRRFIGGGRKLSSPSHSSRQFSLPHLAQSLSRETCPSFVSIQRGPSNPAVTSLSASSIRQYLIPMNQGRKACALIYVLIQPAISAICNCPKSWTRG